MVSADGMSNSNSSWISMQWESARVKWKEHPDQDFLFVIDEIQKIDNWSETIKLEWDRDTREGRPIKVILSGSSRLLLQKGLTESMAGRFELNYLGHWSFLEMHEAFGWDHQQYVWFGGYPGSAGLIEEESRWKRYISDSIIETSVSKDILMLTRIDKPALMRRLFELGCVYSGQILSYTKILGQLTGSGNTVTLSHYLNLLDQAGLLAGIEKYSATTIRQRSSSPKFQVHNTALISAQRNETLQMVSARPDLLGRMVESSIGAHLLNHSLTQGYKLYYWRDRNDEVDYVLEKKGDIIGLEVTVGETHKRHGMQAFQNRYQPKKVLMVGKSGIPWHDFLAINPGELF